MDKMREQGADSPALADLRSLHVRLILPDEDAAWNEHMTTHHYLGYQPMVGESLKYVALLQGEWVALLGWAAGALKCRARDAWIGWTPEQQWQRLRYVVNNQRFLLLPAAAGVRNLASKTLAVNLKRLSADWESAFGHPVVLVETFVDPRRFRGTCYRAANWKLLGFTQGYGRHAGRYYYHGQRKMIWVRPLRPDTRALLSAPFLPPPLRGKGPMIVDLNDLDIAGRGGLLDRFYQLSDLRKLRGRRHRHASVLAVAACAKLSGASGYRAMAQWAKTLTQDLLERLHCRYSLRLGCYEPPSQSTIQRTVKATDADAFDQLVADWYLAQLDIDVDEQEQPAEDDDDHDPPGVAIDGKTLRGARGSNGRGVHLMAAVLHKQKTVISQKQVDSKSNEITAFKPLLDPVDLKGKVITGDPMHAQREHARYLVEEKEADYFFTVKGNQPGVLEDIQLLNDEHFSRPYETWDRGHGRIEHRSIQTSAALQGYVDFPYAAQVCRIERTRRELDGTLKSREVAYGITSLTPQQAGPQSLLRYNRQHWHIENSLHWVRDVTFNEDRSQIRTGAGPRVVATLCNLAINLLRLRGCANIAEALRQNAWGADKGQVLNLLGV